MLGLFVNTRSEVAVTKLSLQKPNQRGGKPVPRKRKGNGKAKGGLKRWFAEKWVDVKTGKPCGRSKGEKRRFKKAKTSSKKIPYQHRRRKKK